MNIFALDECPIVSARCLCDKHVPKMCVETAQMMASALIRHGVEPADMPLTKAGTPYKGGYKNHPCTIWAGDNSGNFSWLAEHGIALCNEFDKRFKKTHGCTDAITAMRALRCAIPVGMLTPHAQAMPGCYKRDYHVSAYRSYYMGEKMHFARWDHGPAPVWLRIGAVLYVRDAA